MTECRKRRGKRLKAIAIVVICLFTLNNLVWADPDLFQSPQNLAPASFFWATSAVDSIETGLMLYLKGLQCPIEKIKYHLYPVIKEKRVHLRFDHKEKDDEGNWVVPCFVDDKKYNAKINPGDYTVSFDEEAAPAKPKPESPDMVKKPKEKGGSILWKGKESEEKFKTCSTEDVTAELTEDIADKLEYFLKGADLFQEDRTKLGGLFDALKSGEYKIYTFDSIVKNENDFRLAYHDPEKKEIYLALDVMEELQRFAELPEYSDEVLDEFLVHVLIAPFFGPYPAGHSRAIVAQLNVYTKNYTGMGLSKGLLAKALKAIIDKKLKALVDTEAQDTNVLGKSKRDDDANATRVMERREAVSEADTRVLPSETDTRVVKPKEAEDDASATNIMRPREGQEPEFTFAGKRSSQELAKSLFHDAQAGKRTITAINLTKDPFGNTTEEVEINRAIELAFDIKLFEEDGIYYIFDLKSDEIKPESPETPPSTPDGYIHKGEKSEDRFNLILPALRNEGNRIIEYKRINEVLDVVLNSKGLSKRQGQAFSRIKRGLVSGGYKLYGFTSIVEGAEDYHLGVHFEKEGEIFFATNVINTLAKIDAENKGKTNLVDEYILHEVLCPIIGHYDAILIQQQMLPEHYPHKEKLAKQTRRNIYKGMLGDALRGIIDEKAESKAKMSKRDKGEEILKDILTVVKEVTDPAMFAAVPPLIVKCIRRGDVEIGSVRTLIEALAQISDERVIHNCKAIMEEIERYLERTISQEDRESRSAVESLPDEVRRQTEDPSAVIYCLTGDGFKLVQGNPSHVMDLRIKFDCRNLVAETPLYFCLVKGKVPNNVYVGQYEGEHGVQRAVYVPQDVFLALSPRLLYVLFLTNKRIAKLLLKTEGEEEPKELQQTDFSVEEINKTISEYLKEAQKPPLAVRKDSPLYYAESDPEKMEGETRGRAGEACTVQIRSEDEGEDVIVKGSIDKELHDIEHVTILNTVSKAVKTFVVESGKDVALPLVDGFEIVLVEKADRLSVPCKDKPIIFVNKSLFKALYAEDREIAFALLSASLADSFICLGSDKGGFPRAFSAYATVRQIKGFLFQYLRTRINTERIRAILDKYFEPNKSFYENLFISPDTEKDMASAYQELRRMLAHVLKINRMPTRKLTQQACDQAVDSILSASKKVKDCVAVLLHDLQIDAAIDFLDGISGMIDQSLKGVKSQAIGLGTVRKSCTNLIGANYTKIAGACSDNWEYLHRVILEIINICTIDSSFEGMVVALLATLRHVGAKPGSLLNQVIVDRGTYELVKKAVSRFRGSKRLNETEEYGKLLELAIELSGMTQFNIADARAYIKEIVSFHSRKGGEFSKRDFYELYISVYELVLNLAEGIDRNKRTTELIRVLEDRIRSGSQTDTFDDNVILKSVLALSYRFAGDFRRAFDILEDILRSSLKEGGWSRNSEFLGTVIFELFFTYAHITEELNAKKDKSAGDENIIRDLEDRLRTVFDADKKIFEDSPDTKVLHDAFLNGDFGEVIAIYRKGSEDIGNLFDYLGSTLAHIYALLASGDHEPIKEAVLGLFRLDKGESDFEIMELVVREIAAMHVSLPQSAKEKISEILMSALVNNEVNERERKLIIAFLVSSWDSTFYEYLKSILPQALEGKQVNGFSARDLIEKKEGLLRHFFSVDLYKYVSALNGNLERKEVNRDVMADFIRQLNEFAMKKPEIFVPNLEEMLNSGAYETVMRSSEKYLSEEGDHIPLIYGLRCAVAKDKAGEILRILREARTLYGKHDYAAALQRVEEALDINPNDLNLHQMHDSVEKLVTAEDAYRRGDTDEAIKIAKGAEKPSWANGSTGEKKKKRSKKSKRGSIPQEFIEKVRQYDAAKKRYETNPDEALRILNDDILKTFPGDEPALVLRDQAASVVSTRDSILARAREAYENGNLIAAKDLFLQALNMGRDVNKVYESALEALKGFYRDGEYTASFQMANALLKMYPTKPALGKIRNDSWANIIINRIKPHYHIISAQLETLKHQQEREEETYGQKVKYFYSSITFTPEGFVVRGLGRQYQVRGKPERVLAEKAGEILRKGDSCCFVSSEEKSKGAAGNLYGNATQMLKKAKTAEEIDAVRRWFEEAGSLGEKAEYFTVEKVEGDSVTFIYDDLEQRARSLLCVPPKGFIRKVEDASLFRQREKIEEIIKHLERYLEEGESFTTGNKFFDALFGITEEEINEVQKASLTLLKEELKDDSFQMEALFHGLDPANGVTLIQGPPGTGKTTVIAEIVNELVRQGKKVLVVSQSHPAVDNVGKIFKKTGIEFARVGCNDKKISREIIEFWDRRQEILEKFRREYYEEDKGFVVLGTNNGYLNDRFVRKSPFFQEFDVVIIEEAGKATVSETIVPITMAGKKVILVGDHRQLPAYGVDQNDEDIVREEIKKYGLKLENAGLPSVDTIFSAENKTDFKRSLFQRAFELEKEKETALDRHMLRVNRRSPPVIVGLVNIFYDGKLHARDHDKERKETPEEDTLKLVDIAGKAERINSSTSFLNLTEVDTVLSELYRILEQKDAKDEYRYKLGDITVISPYLDQNSMIILALRIKVIMDKIMNSSDGLKLSEEEQSYLRQGLREGLHFDAEAERFTEEFIQKPYRQDAEKFARYLKFRIPLESKRVLTSEEVKGINNTVSTMDSIQGHENKVVIVSFVQSGTEGKIGFLGTFDGLQRTNVALSRAQEKMIIIGDFERTLAKARGTKARKTFRQIQEYVKEMAQRGKAQYENRREGSGDGFIRQGERSERAFQYQYKKDITKEYRERFGKVRFVALMHSVLAKADVADEKRAELEELFRKIREEYSIHGFNSIVSGRDDFFLGWNNEEDKKLFLATDLMAELENRGPPSLVYEYILHEFICPVLGHYEAIALQQKIFPEHYISPDNEAVFEENDVKYVSTGDEEGGRKIYKGALGRALRDKINSTVKLEKRRGNILFIGGFIAFFAFLGTIIATIWHADKQAEEYRAKIKAEEEAEKKRKEDERKKEKDEIKAELSEWAKKIQELDPSVLADKINFLFGNTFKDVKDIDNPPYKTLEESIPWEFFLLEAKDAIKEAIDVPYDIFTPGYPGAEGCFAAYKEKIKEVLQISEVESVQERIKKAKTKKERLGIFLSVLENLPLTLENMSVAADIDLEGLMVEGRLYIPHKLRKMLDSCYPQLSEDYPAFEKELNELLRYARLSKHERIAQREKIKEFAAQTNSILINEGFFISTALFELALKKWLFKSALTFELKGEKTYLLKRFKECAQVTAAGVAEDGSTEAGAVFYKEIATSARKHLDVVNGRKEYSREIYDEYDIGSNHETFNREMKLTLEKAIQEDKELADPAVLAANMMFGTILHEHTHLLDKRLEETGYNAEEVTYLLGFAYQAPHIEMERQAYWMMNGRYWIYCDVIAPIVGMDPNSARGLISKAQRASVLLEAIKRFRKMSRSEIQKRAKEELQKRFPEIYEVWESEEGKKAREDLLERLKKMNSNDPYLKASPDAEGPAKTMGSPKVSLGAVLGIVLANKMTDKTPVSRRSFFTFGLSEEPHQPKEQRASVSPEGEIAASSCITPAIFAISTEIAAITVVCVLLGIILLFEAGRLMYDAGLFQRLIHKYPRIKSFLHRLYGLDPEEKHIAEILLRNAPSPYHIIDHDGTIIRVNPMWLNIMGFKETEEDKVLGRSIFEFVDPEQRENAIERFKARINIWKIRKQMSQLNLTSKGYAKLRKELDATPMPRRVMMDEDGHEREYKDRIYRKRGKSDGEKIIARTDDTITEDMVITSFQDITELRDIQDEREEMARRDPHTGLHNIRHLKAEVSDFLIRKGEKGREASVLTISLDLFEDIGRDPDEFAATMGEKIKECLEDVKGDRPIALTYLGNGIYGVFIRGNKNESIENTVRTIVEKLPRKLKQVVSCGGKEFALHGTISSGASIYPYNADDADNLIYWAKAAMKAAKKQEGNTLVFCDDDLKLKDMQQLKLESRLRESLYNMSDNGFSLHFQPQVNLETNEIEGVEALIRWDDIRLGRVFPDQFITLAEEREWIGCITGWVLREACKQAYEWQKKGYNIKISVNISAKDLHRLEPTVVTTLQDALDNVKEREARETGTEKENVLGLERGRIALEITEHSVVRDKDRAISIINQLRDMGVEVHIDDFGVKRSALVHLSELPCDVVKLDLDFIKDIGRVPHKSTLRHKNLVRGIIEMAHGMSVKVIAEGVETREQLELLRSFGCDYAQGYFRGNGLGRPAPASEIEKALMKQENPPEEGSWLIENITDKVEDEIYAFRERLNKSLARFGHTNEGTELAFRVFFDETLPNATYAKSGMIFTEEHGDFNKFAGRVDISNEEKRRLVHAAINIGRPLTKIRVEWYIDEERITLKVSNNSEPTEYHASRIRDSFNLTPEDFFSKEEVTARINAMLGRFSGMGRGIFLVRRVAEAAGGTLSHNIEGGWTAFEMTLPKKEEPSGETPSETRNLSGFALVGGASLGVTAALIIVGTLMIYEVLLYMYHAGKFQAILNKHPKVRGFLDWFFQAPSLAGDLQLAGTGVNIPAVFNEGQPQEKSDEKNNVPTREPKRAPNLIEGWTQLEKIISERLGDGRDGVKVIIWGYPGTAKTTIAALIAKFGIGDISPNDVAAYIERRAGFIPHPLPKYEDLGKKLVVAEGFFAPEWFKQNGLEPDIFVLLTPGEGDNLDATITDVSPSIKKGFHDLFAENLEREPNDPATWDAIINSSRHVDLDALMEHLQSETKEVKEEPESTEAPAPEKQTIWRDVTYTEEMLLSLIEEMLSLGSNKEVALVFDENIGEGQEVNPLDGVLAALVNLRQNPKYKKILEKLKIIVTSPENMRTKIDEDVGQDAEIFVFARNGEDKELTRLELDKKVHAVYIDEINQEGRKFGTRAYYPLAEIVVVSIAQSIAPIIGEHAVTTVLEVAGIEPIRLDEINIESVIRKGNTLLFTLLPDAKEYDKSELIQKYATLKRFLKAA